MKIYNSSDWNQLESAKNVGKSTNVQYNDACASSMSADKYDLDISIETRGDVGSPPKYEFVTSKSLCTPGCGNTGTYNSYCC